MTKDNWRAHEAAQQLELDDGFTLLELLVAIALLGLIFAALAGSLRFGAAAWERGGAVSARTTELQLAQQFLRPSIEQMVPAMLSRRGQEESVAVSGTETMLRFVGVPPGHLAKPGPYLVQLSVDTSGARRSLVFSWRSLQPDLSDFTEGRDVESTTLVFDIDAAAFAYFGRARDREKPEWHTRWTAQKRLPELVRITVTYAGQDRREWPPLIVAPQIQTSR